MNDGPEDDPLESFDVEKALLGGKRQYTRVQVAEKAGVPMELAEELWQQLGFPHTDDDDVAFTKADVTALKQTAELIDLGILEPDSQAALVRTYSSWSRVRTGHAPAYARRVLLNLNIDRLRRKRVVEVGGAWG